MTELSEQPSDPSGGFSTDPSGLAPAVPPSVVRLHHGDNLDLRIGPVAKRIGEDVVRMLAYNGSIPGPVLHVDEGSTIGVEVRNDGDTEATVHWHGLRLENRYDGVPHETQAPIPVGATFGYEVQFPDPGFYWYHPHVREDYDLEMGLYGTIIVEPADPAYWPLADRQLSITLDDLLMEEGHIAPFDPAGPTYTAMGRFGNVMLTNGDTSFSEEVAVGEVVRLYLVNTANTRTFNVALPGAHMKLVGGDSGRYERETFVDEVLLAPSERAIVDVLFTTAGEVHLEHRPPGGDLYTLGVFSVSGTAAGDAARAFDTLRTDPVLTAEREALAHHLERPPDKILGFSSLMPILYGNAGAVAELYACSMHPEVTATTAETCPQCGMKLVAVQPTVYACPMHPEVTATTPETCPRCGMKLVPASAAATTHEGEGHHAGGHGHDSGDGIEWEDLMPDINRQTNPTNMIWKVIDRQTGDENAAIKWSFAVGDRVKIRLVNEMEGSEHPMHHPFHIHGAGRFLVLSRQGVPETNLLWKDTVLVPAGHTVDILLDVSNPGRWMAHCHIAEHNQSGMMFSFDVLRAASSPV
ncbi:MAG TPA: multicopper oxidase family protein [Acidimicrobiales bacterium]|nr:multicopper oxidase family protein [Acidimicrobiales bacterium]